MASQQDLEDANIIWEDLEVPARVDDYIFEKGKRLVRPYYFEFIAHVKKRWIGKIIVDVYTQEFKGRPREYYVRAVERGRIRVNGRRVSPAYALRDSEKLSHFVHRHEPPVMAEPVRILEEGKDVITVCKPASIPVHPCGQYRKNTVLGILETEHQTGPLFPIHRLDRLVSGLLIMARNAETANVFREEIQGGMVEKRYVAKVKGVFPEHDIKVDAPVYYDAREGVSSIEITGSRGKAACTRFRRLSTDGVCSIVRCEPITGRTHQIRVHLRHLGHPIANDRLYLRTTLPKRSTEGLRANSLIVESSVVRDEHAVGSLVRVSYTSLTAAGEELAEDSIRPPAIKEFEVGEVELFSCSEGCQTSNHGGSRKGFQEEASLESAQDELKSEHRVVDSEKTSEDVSNLTKTQGCSSEGSHRVDCIRRDHTPESPVINLKSEECCTGQQFSVDPFCTNCPNLEPFGYSIDDDGLWLHCVRYASTAWAFECPLPAWAS